MKTKLLAIVSLLLISLTVSAYDFTVDGLYYNILSKEDCTCGVTQKHWSGTPEYSGDIVIPASVEYDGNTYIVTEITAEAFYGCDIVSLIVPESVTIIGSGAFVDCKKLETVVLPNTITELGAPTYTGNGGWAFSGCSSLKTINIPTSISTLRATTFAECSSLETIKIPSNITTIGLSVFYNCTSLTSIEIPAEVTEFGINPFWGCVNLGEIKFTGNDKYYFENNCLLSTDGRLITVLDQSMVTIPSTINTIDDGAFTICKNLQSVEIPNSVTKIGMFAFAGCVNLQSLRLPNNISSIPSNCFENCSNLSEFEIPATVSEIGDNPFFGCTNLSRLSVEGGDKYFVEDDCLIESSGALICALDKEEITIPNSVYFLKSFAIGGCKKLSSVVIPSSVTSSNGRIISSCPNLKAIYCFCEPFYSQDPYNPSLILFANEDSDHHPDCKIYVPKSMLDDYMYFWEHYADMIEPINIYIVGDEITDENENTYEITSVEGNNKTCNLTKFTKTLSNLVNLIIPETVEGFAVTSISAKASTSRMSKTASLTLPKTIRSISDKAFKELKNLTTVYCFAESMDNYGAGIFYANENLKIYVPESSVECYKTAWSDLADYIFPMDEEMDIDAIYVSNTSNSQTYNLYGQPVSKDHKGIVIHGGKMMLRKN